MANILSHNKHIFDIHPVRSDYWDFQLSKDRNGYIGLDTDNDCLVMEIDTNKEECLINNEDEGIGLASTTDSVWSGATNNGLELDNVGFTGVDNGIIHYDKDAISNRRFLDLFFNSKLEILEGDTRFFLRSVNGNNKIYDYPVEFVEEEGKTIARLNGGFFQGFVKDCDSDYQVLPIHLGKGWTFEISFNKKDLPQEKTLNLAHPDNAGIILYIGTRSENKWWEKYVVNTEFAKNCSNESYSNDGYSDDEYFGSKDDGLNGSYIHPYIEKENVVEEELETIESYFTDGYLAGEYERLPNCPTCNTYINDGYFANEGEGCFDSYLKDKSRCQSEDCADYVKDGYFATDEVIDPEMNIEIEDGISIYQPNVQKIETDNKFLIYDRTPEGYTTEDKDVPERITLLSTTYPSLTNYFLLFNRTPEGYTTDTIGELEEEASMEYNVLKDLYRNAFAIQIKDDGSIGYKYLIKDCEAEDEQYEILSEFTSEGLVSNDEWNTIHIKIVPEGVTTNIFGSTCPDPKDTADSMRVSIYLNGKLVLRSKKLPILNLHQLDDLCEKQETVPYNISLGGGTQGLCDVIYLNYRKTPEYVLPLEKEFAGTFVGDIKTFRFYDCDISFNLISGNV